MKEFFKNASNELSQVTWLTKNQAIRLSIITLISVLISAFLLWGVDLILTEAYHLLK